MGNKVRGDRQMRALTGPSFGECEQLLRVFSSVYEAYGQQLYAQAVQSGSRLRKSGGGRKCKLSTSADKLPFVLNYYKEYPTFDALGYALFNQKRFAESLAAYDRAIELAHPVRLPQLCQARRVVAEASEFVMPKNPS